MNVMERTILAQDIAKYLKESKEKIMDSLSRESCIEALDQAMETINPHNQSTNAAGGYNWCSHCTPKLNRTERLEMKMNAVYRALNAMSALRGFK